MTHQSNHGNNTYHPSYIWPTLDAEKPFFKDFSGTYVPQDANPILEQLNNQEFIEKRYAHEGRPLTQQAYLQTFKALINREAFMSALNGPILTRMWEDAKKLADILSPLDQLSIAYKLDLTGGSVRDLVLGQSGKIKDLDFMLSIPFPYGSRLRVHQRVQAFFSAEAMQQVGWNAHDNADEMKIKLVALCLEQRQYGHTDFNFRKEKETTTDSEYAQTNLSKRLIAVIKPSAEKFNFPVDILLTDLHKNEFIKGFDFDLCKAGFSLITPQLRQRFPDQASHLVSRFCAEVDFFADVVNKRITYNCNNVGRADSYRALKSHLPRIKTKYPEHELLVIGNKEQDVSYIKSLALKLQLEEAIPIHKETSSRRTKI